MPAFQLSAVAIGAQRPEEPFIRIGAVTGLPSTHTRHQPGRPGHLEDRELVRPADLDSLLGRG